MGIIHPQVKAAFMIRSFVLKKRSHVLGLWIYSAGYIVGHTEV